MSSDYGSAKDIKKEHYNMRDVLTEDKKKEILQKHFKKRVGYDLDFDNPKTFNEKIMWTKLYYQDPLITKCCDKYAVKDYVNETIGEGHIVPTIAAWDNPDDIDFDHLPDKFALKVNWSSGYNIICKDKSKLDYEKTREQVRKWMKPDRNAYYQYFNWGFKHMKPVVYAEEYIEQVDGQVYDYKFFAFNGEVKMMFVATDRSDKLTLTYDFFDRDYNLLPFTYGMRKHADPVPEKPKHYDEMIELAEKLAKPFPFVRVDFYEVGDRIMLGEMTFYSGGGMLPINPVEWDYKIGEWFELPEKKITDKSGVLEPVKLTLLKGKHVVRRKIKNVRRRIVKHVVIRKKHYLNVFGKLRIPFSKRGGYIRMEGLEVKRRRNQPVTKAENVNLVFPFKFEKMDPMTAYMMEDKITMDMKKHYCEQKGYKQLKYFPNLTNPTTFNEKLLWLALYYKNPNYSIACDKAKVRDWVGERIGYDYTVPIIGVYDDVNAIDFDTLPDKFVIKANNGWGANEVVLINDKKQCDIDNLKALASTWLYPWKFYYYQNMCITDEKPEKPLIVIEEMLEPEGSRYLNDYKLYCCNGKVKFSMIVTDRGSKDQARTFVDSNWEVLPIRRAGKFSNDQPDKPDNYDRMVQLAEILSKDMPFVRIDFYNVDGHIYVGEMTFTPGLFLRFEPKEADMFLGKYLDIDYLVDEFNSEN